MLGIGKQLKVFSSKRKPKNSTPTSYCVDLVRRHDYENFLCTLLLPQTARGAAFAVRAFNVEVSKASESASDLRIANVRMEFWKESLEKVFSGRPPQQPVALELAKTLKTHKLPKRQLLRLVNARRQHLGQHCFDNIDRMETYAEEVFSPLLYLSLEAAGVKNVEADHVASHVGKAQGLATLLRAVTHTKSTTYLPGDLLQKVEIVPGKEISAEHVRALAEVAYGVASRAKLHLDKARSLSKSLPKGSQVFMLPAKTTGLFLEALEEAQFNVFDPYLQMRNIRLGFILFWAKLSSSY